MKRILNILFVLTIVVTLNACGSKKATNQKKKDSETSIEKESSILSDNTANSQTKNESTNTTSIPDDNNDGITYSKNTSTKSYIRRFSRIAKKKMVEHKIPASITLAQGILESNSGNSTLTVGYNNHFGIKCHKQWKGERTYYDDDKKSECFRVYNDAESSFEDHSLFLTTRPRYAGLFKLKPDDYFGWAYGLSRAGYATDKRYAQKLIKIIEENNLHKYDLEVLNKKPEPTYHIVEKGETLESIAHKYDLDVADLKRFNKIYDDKIYYKMRLNITEKADEINNNNVVLTPETNPVQEEQAIHIVEPGETLYSISKLHKLTVNELMLLNELKDNNVNVGDPLFINKARLNQISGNNVTNNTTVTETPEYHTVQQGETLYKIGYKYNLSIKDLRELNNLESDDVYIGQKIFLKKKQGSTPAPQEVNTPNNQINTHTVQPGETLYRIATNNNISVEQLRALNGLNNNTIFVGQVLKLN